MIPSIRIGPVEYQVREVDDLHFVNDEGRKASLHGDIRWGESDIRVSNDNSEQVKICTLWHEAVHGILHNAGQEHMEEVVIALGYGLVQLIRDNPALIEYTLNGNQPDSPIAP